MPKPLLRSMNLWGGLHVAVVAVALLFASGVHAQDESVDKFANKGAEFKETADLMRTAYWTLKRDNWKGFDPDYVDLADEANRQKRAINPSFYEAFMAPTQPRFDKIALICSTYYHPRSTKEASANERHPSGFFLVMYKNSPDIVTVPGRDVRLLPTGGPDGEADEVYPGMECYDQNLDPLPEYQSPWFKGEGPE